MIWVHGDRGLMRYQYTLNYYKTPIYDCRKDTEGPHEVAGVLDWHVISICHFEVPLDKK